MVADSQSHHTISNKSSEKVLEILLHTINSNIKNSLQGLLDTSNNFTPAQSEQLGQLKDSIDRMELIMSKTLNIDAMSSISELDTVNSDIRENIYVEKVLRSLAENTSTQNSHDFFQYCIKTLAELYECQFAFIGIIKENKEDVRTLCVWSGDRFVDNFEYALEGTPCKDAIDLSKRLIPTDVANLYPKDELLIEMGVDSYYGIPLITNDSGVIGILSVMDTKPMYPNKWTSPVLGVFASRITLEVLRQRANDKVISLNKDLEKRIKLRTHELETAITELKSFNYSVSHDLRSPVRAINSFMDIIQDDFSHQIPEEARDYFNRVKRAGSRLNDLIDGMLSLSQISHHEILIKKIDLSQLYHESVDHQRNQFPLKNIQFQISQDMTAWADKKLLRLAIDNLVSNAWKYTANQENPFIEIGNYLEKEETIFFIKDNGDGFNAGSATRLFEPFQRMHTNKEFEGIGIGLANTRRVINRHGGRIWVEASKGKGATFFFTLGKAKPIRI